jgi:hypothetical protein
LVDLSPATVALLENTVVIALMKIIVGKFGKFNYTYGGVTDFHTIF